MTVQLQGRLHQLPHYDAPEPVSFLSHHPMDHIFRDTEQSGRLHDASLMREAHSFSAAPGMF